MLRFFLASLKEGVWASSTSGRLATQRKEKSVLWSQTWGTSPGGRDAEHTGPGRKAQWDVTSHTISSSVKWRLFYYFNLTRFPAFSNAFTNTLYIYPHDTPVSSVLGIMGTSSQVGETKGLKWKLTCLRSQVKRGADTELMVLYFTFCKTLAIPGLPWSSLRHDEVRGTSNVISIFIL